METPGTVSVVDFHESDRVLSVCLFDGTQLEKRTAGLFFCGSVPEWLKGTGCKPVGYAYLGSNPSAPTTRPHSSVGRALPW